MTGRSAIRKAFALAAGMTLAAPSLSMADTGLIGSVAAAAPLVIPAGALATAAIWFIMRTIPPKPKQQDFPPARLLHALESRRMKPTAMPLWQRIMRATALTLATAGLAQMYYNPNDMMAGSGTVALAVNNGAFAGAHWESRFRTMEDIIDRAERAGRPVVFIATAAAADGAPVRVAGPVGAAEARRMVRETRPQAWMPDDKAAAAALRMTDIGNDADVIFLDDGIDGPDKAALIDQLRRMGHLTVIDDGVTNRPHILKPADGKSETLEVEILRPQGSGKESVMLIASDRQGHVMGQAKAEFEDGALSARADFGMIAGIRSQLNAVSIRGETGAGATLLLDDNAQLRPVGLVDAVLAEIRSSLLDEALYIDGALRPHSRLRRGRMEDILKSSARLSVIVLPGAVSLTRHEHDRIDAWVKNGGTLLRFAGPQVAAAQEGAKDSLLPVELQPGVRSLNKGLSGSGAGRLREFGAASPFGGIKIPNDLVIRKQILAKPSRRGETLVWAELEDRTPVVTASKHGKGQVVFFHSAIDGEWSDMHLSGDLFINMLQAVVGGSRSLTGANALAADEKQQLPPITVLDGTGRLSSPSPVVRPLDADRAGEDVMGPLNPPGLYGNPDNGPVAAFNLYQGVSAFKDFTVRLKDVKHGTFDTGQGGNDLAGILLLLSMAAVALDYGVLLRQGGRVKQVQKTGASFEPK